jgi:uncharacterized protein (DUF433 family)
LTTQDPRNTPSYRLSEAAHYLRIPKATLRSWLVGQGSFKPVIAIADRQKLRLSFINLVEAHVLDALRRQHQIPLQKVRQALATLGKLPPPPEPSRHPLAHHRFVTDGKQLLVDKLGELINLNEQGQGEMKAALDQHLKRIDWAKDGAAARLFPFTRKRQANEPRAVVIDPRLSFGRPVLAGTGIATAVVAERYKAGESIQDLAKDYGRKALEIEEAIRCELSVQAG